MHEQKVSTNGGEMSSSDVKKSTFVIEGEHAQLVFTRRNALYDHVCMRNQQLHALLMMTYGEGAEQFSHLGQDNRDMVLWLIHQMTSEVAQATRLLVEGVQ